MLVNINPAVHFTVRGLMNILFEI